MIIFQLILPIYYYLGGDTMYYFVFNIALLDNEEFLSPGVSLG